MMCVADVFSSYPLSFMSWPPTFILQPPWRIPTQASWWCQIFLQIEGRTGWYHLLVVWQEILISEITHCGVWLEWKPADSWASWSTIPAKLCFFVFYFNLNAEFEHQLYITYISGPLLLLMFKPSSSDFSTTKCAQLKMPTTYERHFFHK